MARSVARSRGFQIAYDDAGSGPPVVLVSGFAWPAASWRELGYVDRLIADGYRVLAVDPLGHGLSDAPHEWEHYVAPEVATDVLAACDAAGVSEVAVWGYSRGAGLATMVAAEFPDRVAALVAGGLTWFGSSEDDANSPEIRALARGDWDGFWEHLGSPVPDADRLTMQGSDARAMAAVQIGRIRSHYVVDPSCVSAPTLLYYGANDTWAPVEAAKEAFGVEPHVLAGRHDHSKAVRDVGTVAPVVLDFLRAVLPANHAGSEVGG